MGSVVDQSASDHTTQAMPCRGAVIDAIVECVWPAHAILGEGCCWDPRSGKIFWVDIKGIELYALSASSGRRQVWTLPCRIGSLAVPPPDWHPPDDFVGELFLACGDLGLMWLALRATDVGIFVVASPESHLPENRFNDGKIGPDRRYWAGTMHDLEVHTSGSLYAFSSNGGVTLLDSGYRVTNGPAFSPDGRTVYHTDSTLQTVYAFDLSPEGQVRNKRLFVQFEAGEGYPDGMTTDARGNLWIAIWDGARIEKISPKGERVGHIRMPTPRVTSCTFVGEDATVMYATSARIGVSETDELAGGLFKLILL
jgi:D-xylonolactonase